MENINLESLEDQVRDFLEICSEIKQKLESEKHETIY